MTVPWRDRDSFIGSSDVLKNGISEVCPTVFLTSSSALCLFDVSLLKKNGVACLLPWKLEALTELFKSIVALR